MEKKPKRKLSLYRNAKIRKIKNYSRNRMIVSLATFSNLLLSQGWFITKQMIEN
jgi:hypothetical protein